MARYLSAADLKAFCGRNGGIVCTSSNAPAVINWAFQRGKRVLFFPDEHLGRPTFPSSLEEGTVPPTHNEVSDGLAAIHALAVVS